MTMVDMAASAAGASPPSSSPRSLWIARRAAAMVEEAVARGVVPPDQPPPAAIAHALICSCGSDVDVAVALWKTHLRPNLLRVRREGVAELPTVDGAQPTAEQASFHALLRVCGTAQRADEALRVVYAMKRDGLPIDAACYTAYRRGVTAAQAEAHDSLLQGAARSDAEDGSDMGSQRDHRRGHRRDEDEARGLSLMAAARSRASDLLQGAYERLLLMELCPERSERPRLGGKIERIRIQF